MEFLSSPTYHLHRELWIPRTLEQCFRFFDRPENLARITPPRLGFVVKTPSPVPMHTGALIDYTIRVLGLPLGWRTRILSYTPPHEFIDEQLRGPYKLWHHEHRFVAENGGTKITDDVDYSVGWGLIGRLAQAIYVRRSVEDIFDYRRQRIEQLLAEGAF